MSTKAVIFDFNHTLYDPEAQALVPGTLSLLKQLRTQGIILFLVAKGGEERVQQIQNQGLAPFFTAMIVRPEKTKDDMLQCMNQCPPETAFFVVGDRVRKEIRFGNECGMTTIWLKTGKFSEEVPTEEIEQPDYTIAFLSKAKDIVLSPIS